MSEQPIVSSTPDESMVKLDRTAVPTFVHDAAAESEARYRTLFNSMDEGFCIVELISDDQGRPVDFRFLEVNPAFERQSGLSDVVGRRVRELIPEMETYWFETYAKVASRHNR